MAYNHSFMNDWFYSISVVAVAVYPMLSLQASLATIKPPRGSDSMLARPARPRARQTWKQRPEFDFERDEDK